MILRVSSRYAQMLRPRVLFLFVCMIVTGLALPSVAAAQTTSLWPPYPLDGNSFPSADELSGRGPGGYLSVFSIVLYILLFVLWIKIVDWVNKDTFQTKMPYSIWNAVVFFPFLIGFFVFGMSMPYIGFLLSFATVIGPFATYVVMRNKKVPDYQRVFTPDHLRHLFSRKAAGVGVKVDAEKKADYEKGAPVDLIPSGGETDRDNTANLLKSRQSPGFVEAKNLIADAIDRRAERVMLDYAQQGVGVKYQIDGVWHEVEPRDRESSDPMLAVMKTLANLNASERRARQDGKFGVEYSDNQFVCLVSSQGTETGERAIVAFENKKVTLDTLDDAGMRPKMQEQLKQLCSGKGFVLVSSMPSGGLTTTTTLLLKSLDRYMRDFVGLEDSANPQPDVENIQPERYDASAGESPADLLPNVFRKQPDVVVLYDLPDAKSVSLLCSEVKEDVVAIGTLRAKDAAEALLRVLMLKVPATEFAPVAKAVLNQRLIRKLCECKQAYAPSPELLKKLGIPAGKVQALYRPPPPPEKPEDLCQICGGIGYHGRTSIFELLVVDDKVRQALIKQPKIDLIRKLARAAGNRGLQDEGILLVAKGVTSLQELQRVLK